MQASCFDGFLFSNENVGAAFFSRGTVGVRVWLTSGGVASSDFTLPSHCRQCSQAGGRGPHAPYRLLARGTHSVLLIRLEVLQSFVVSGAELP